MNAPTTSEQIKHFRKHGWVRIPKLHSADQVRRLRAGMEKAFANPPDLKQTYGAAGATTPKDVVSNKDAKPVLLNVREINRYDADVREICLDPFVGRVLESLFGTARVRLFSETFLNKPPGGHPTPWHQDLPLQPFDRRESVNCWVALDDIPLEQGPVQVVSGSHRLGALYMPTDFAEQPSLEKMLSPEDVELLWSLADPSDIAVEGVPVHSQPYSAGDGLIFYGSALHGAPTNKSDRPRRGYSRTIISSETRYTGMPYLKTDGAGMAPGDLFDREFYPLFPT